MLSPKIVAVVAVPYCGIPEDSSKIEPTAAIVKMQQIISKMPDFGVPTIVQIVP
jgi:hypothetical protein